MTPPINFNKFQCEPDEILLRIGFSMFIQQFNHSKLLFIVIAIFLSFYIRAWKSKKLRKNVRFIFIAFCNHLRPAENNK